MDDLELVVARCHEDLAWLRRVPESVRVTVYDKGGDAPGAVRLPNHGRESHTYLHHIVTRYDDLAGLTVFCQGRPFDHVPSFHRVLRELASGAGREEAFRWLGFIIDYDDPEGTRLFRKWTKNEGARTLDMAGFWRGLWDTGMPDRFVFYPGGHFVASSELIRGRARSFYQRALDLSLSHPDIGHCFERCWDKLFRVNGIPTEFRDADFPVHLRPIRRLGTTWEDVDPAHRGW
jgi:hypothetical protein